MEINSKTGIGVKTFSNMHDTAPSEFEVCRVMSGGGGSTLDGGDNEFHKKLCYRWTEEFQLSPLPVIPHYSPPVDQWTSPPADLGDQNSGSA